MAIPEVFRPVASTTQVNLRFQQGTNLYENTFYYGWTGAAPSASELLTLAQTFGAGVGEKVRLLLHNSVSLREVYARNIDTQIANQATAFFTPGTNGARTGGAVASNEAGGLVKRSGLSGRSRRGRNSFGPFSEGDVDGNSLSQQLLQLFASLALEMLVNYLGGRFTAAVASRKLGNAVPMRSALMIDSNVDSQKTRLNSHGD